MRNPIFFADPVAWADFIDRASRAGLRFEAWSVEAHSSGCYVVILTGGH